MGPFVRKRRGRSGSDHQDAAFLANFGGQSIALGRPHEAAEPLERPLAVPGDEPATLPGRGAGPRRALLERG